MILSKNMNINQKVLKIFKNPGHPGHFLKIRDKSCPGQDIEKLKKSGIVPAKTEQMVSLNIFKNNNFDEFLIDFYRNSSRP